MRFMSVHASHNASDFVPTTGTVLEVNLLSRLDAALCQQLRALTIGEESDMRSQLSYRHLMSFVDVVQVVLARGPQGVLQGWGTLDYGKVNVFVEPQDRRRGIGRRIVGALRDLNATNPHRFRAFPHDAIGKAFYERVGVFLPRTDEHSKR